MSPREQYRQYQQMEVSTSSDPKKLVLMLYDGCLKFLTIAEQAMKDGDIEKKALHIGKALAIINELNACLDRKLDEEIVPFLDAMYTHMMHKLLEANLTNDPEILRHVYRLVENLRKNWIEHAMAAEKAAPRPAAAPVIEQTQTAKPAPAATYGPSVGSRKALQNAPLSFVI
ncbi:MAG: flagellar export chaperone FliS [Deltaproteobacteria bacterium]|nr:flagellar export chaperone FliS [Candidatus Anaeroferrophillus wilburensis]MBN2888359.1 flagellar export chaperone FliS [Deltaproteobacteria bacterium]